MSYDSFNFKVRVSLFKMYLFLRFRRSLEAHLISLHGPNTRVEIHRPKGLCGAYAFYLFIYLLSFFFWEGGCPTFPLPRDRGREADCAIKRVIESEKDRQKGGEREKEERLQEDRIGLDALAGGYSLCCHGNSREEEDLVSVS